MQNEMDKLRNSRNETRLRIDARRNYEGWVFFSQGFRPFFLGAALWAIIALALWVFSWFGTPVFGLYVDAAWHAHEMLFGFAVAAVAGFLLTAIPNWTGGLPVRGWPLAGLVSLWAIGRIAMLVGQATEPTIAAVLDCLFLLTLSAVAFREIAAGQNWRNLRIVVPIFGLALANIQFHLEQAGMVPDHGFAIRGAVALLVLLVAMIGGRIIPSFTTNALKQRKSAKLPAPSGNTDKLTLLVTLLTGLGFTFFPNALATALFALVCAGLHFLRMSRWCSLHVLFEPMLWILHLSYAWIGIGFALLSAHILFEFPTLSAAIHAFTTGAFASMILAVMTRASRGHTGRALQADIATNLIYACITLAAITRVFGSIFAGVFYHQLATGFWVVAFGVFVVSYWTVLTGLGVRETKADPS